MLELAYRGGGGWWWWWLGVGLIKDNKKHLDCGHQISLLMWSCAKSKHRESERRGCWGEEGSERKSFRDAAALLLGQRGLSYKWGRIRTICSLCLVPIILIWKSDEWSFPQCGLLGWYTSRADISQHMSIHQGAEGKQWTHWVSGTFTFKGHIKADVHV